MKNLIKTLTDAVPVSITMTADDLQAFAEAVAEATIKNLQNVTETPEEWLTAKQVCRLLGVGLSTLWRWGKEGYLSGVKFGNRTRYRKCDVDRVAKAEKWGDA